MYPLTGAPLRVHLAQNAGSRLRSPPISVLGSGRVDVLQMKHSSRPIGGIA